MTADHSSDSGRQRTVAELLEQYGGTSGGGGRRRRRADDDGPPEHPAPESTGSGNGRRSAGADALTSDDTAGYRAGGQGTGSYPTSGRGSDSYARPPRGQGAPGSYGSDAGRHDNELFPNTAPPPPVPGVPAPRWAPGSGSDGNGSTGAYPAAAGTGAYPPASGTGAYPSASSTGAYHSASGTGAYPVSSAGASAAFPAAPARSPEHPTEQFTRYGGQAPQPMDLTGPMTAPFTGSAGSASSTSTSAIPAAAPVDPGPPTGQVAPVDLFGDDEDDDDAAPATAAARRTATKASALPDVPAGLAGDETDDEPRPTGIVGWLGLVGQWVSGVVLGALLWVGFEYLWLNYPVVALVAAVLATAGLVLLVRAIRRSDDLQTTMLAVLVGLVVTISPAVLLLAVR